MAFYNLSTDKVLNELSVNKDTGLTYEEAENRIKKYGKNVLKEK